MTIRRASVALTLVAALAVTPMLTGCFGNPIRSVVSGVTGGNVDLGGKELPASFPKDVPLYNEDITLAVALGNKKDGLAWNVSLRVKSVDDIDKIEAQLTKAGFDGVDGSQLLQQKDKEGRTIVMQDDTYGVVVVVVKSNDEVIANYSVTEVDKSN